MDIFIHILKLFAGIGLFLFAMYLVEESLKNLLGRSFKIFLQRVTGNRAGAVTGGAVITAVLQSSSMVSLMVLAFVGAGVFTLKNAMAIILGANLGTTLSNWMVALLGFKTNIEVIAYPAICAGGMLLVLFKNRKAIKYISYFLLGFGLLFIGLSFMKTAMEAQVSGLDLSQYTSMPLVFFLLIGFVITLLVQSSSVTVALTLSALHAGAIGFPAAAAIVLGSETGTTIKIVLGSVGGSAAKRRVAFGNFLFNVSLTLLAFVFLSPILVIITDVFSISDPLIGLVTFSSAVNFAGIVIFLPFLGRFVKFLEKLFKDTDASAAAFIGNANINEPETALDLFRKETEYFIHTSMLFNLELFELDSIPIVRDHPDFGAINEKKKYFSKSLEEKYGFLKQLQGELQAFYINLRTKLQDGQDPRLNQLISAVRSSMHSVKSMKDIGSNINDLRRSSKDIKFDFFMHHKKEVEGLYRRVSELILQEERTGFEKLRDIFNEIQENYSSALNDFYKRAQQTKLEDLDMTTAINFNRELFTSNKAMLMAVKDLLLDEKQAADFNEIPVYKT